MGDADTVMIRKLDLSDGGCGFDVRMEKVSLYMCITATPQWRFVPDLG